MDFAKLGFFRITKTLELVTYNLNLLDSIRITKIHYILILKLADPEAPLIEDIPDINFKS